jgi:hypothetical protein
VSQHVTQGESDDPRGDAGAIAGADDEDEAGDDGDDDAPPLFLPLGKRSRAPTSGPAAAWGTSNVRSMQTLAEWYNELGGVKIGDKTYELEVITFDDQKDPL